MVLYSRSCAFKDFLHKLSGDSSTALVCKQDFVPAGAVLWARDLADGVQGSRDIGAFPAAGCAAILGRNYRVRIAEALDAFAPAPVS